MERDLESEIRQAARMLENEKRVFENMGMQNQHQEPIARQIQAEEYALARRRVLLAQKKLENLINT